MSLKELRSLINYLMRQRKKKNLVSWFLEPFTDKKGNKPDITLLIIVGILIFFGLIFLSSASSTFAFYNKGGDSYFFVKQQLLNGVLPGIILFYFFLRIDYRIYKKLYWVFFILSLLLLIAVLLFNGGGHSFTAQSWIVIGNKSFQPSEVVKLFFILLLAGYLSTIGNKIKTWSSGTVPFIIILSIISVLILLQPDLGTLSIIVLTALAMFYISGARLSHLSYIISSGLISLIILVKEFEYAKKRFLVWRYPDYDLQVAGYQMHQAMIAIGSGSWFGLGIGSSRQVSYLPMPYNDAIFAIIAEEIGFIFSLAFLALFIIFITRGFAIIKNSKDNFAKLVAMGIVVWLSGQAFINIAGMIKLIPLTGVPLPFISQGGTNMVISLISIGILANISKFTDN